MLEKLEFNKKLFRYRLENEHQLLLYNIRNGQIYLINGRTKEYLLKKINNVEENIIIEDKYIEFLKKNNILEEV